MTIAGLILGMVISSLTGLFFHILKDGGIGKLMLYLVLSWVGFWGAQLVGMALKWEFLNVGALLVGLDLAGSILFLLVGNWLSLVNKDEG